MSYVVVPLAVIAPCILLSVRVISASLLLTVINVASAFVLSFRSIFLITNVVSLPNTNPLCVFRSTVVLLVPDFSPFNVYVPADDVPKSAVTVYVPCAVASAWIPVKSTLLSSEPVPA